jgi:hypothetical protein
MSTTQNGVQAQFYDVAYMDQEAAYSKQIVTTVLAKVKPFQGVLVKKE